ncbi:DNA-directed DNA polymerase II small subunit [Haloarchaeobius sp. TZWWS8]|uniref:DNA-directed DNA polymerase II small subunit n=1 Tax=Haloarchaeobius sp. TZWWS8 TaxID=3446121 RepID=UPI003EBBC57D
MPLEGAARVVGELASHGYNAEREAVTLIARAEDPDATLRAVVDAADDGAIKITADDVRAVRESLSAEGTGGRSTRSTGGRGRTSSSAESVEKAEAPASESDASAFKSEASASKSEAAVSQAEASADSAGTQTAAENTDATTTASDRNPSVSTGDASTGTQNPTDTPPETGGSFERSVDDSLRSVEIAGDVTGQSTGTGEYDDFVTVFRDRYDKLSAKLRGRVNHRPTSAIESMPGGSEVALVGMVNDIRSTASGHWLVELEDTKGTFPCLVMKDRDIAQLVEELLCDEVIAIEGTLSDDAGIVFVDSLYFPDVPRTYEPSYADRHVQAALISDVHVGSQEFMHDEWDQFCNWLHSPEAEHVEYMLIAGDMVEGVGVYPNQDEELDVVDIYEQYESFNEKLKQVPGDLEIVMIPGNHDAVRLAEPQPGFDEELRNIMSAHDARITGNPSTVTIEGVSVLMYHGVSLDEVIAELPEDKASYDEPHKAMYQLLKKRHVAPQYGGHTRVAPEEKDYLVIDDVPDIFHTGHVHKLGFGKYHNVLAINSGCWQSQTDFQKSVNIQPDAGYAPIVDLDTLDVTVRKFS